MTDETITIPAGLGRAARLDRGRCVTVINTHGQQVVDTWAFNAADSDEYMSMEHSRSTLEKLFPAVGESMVTNRRRPILTVVEDTSPGIHDTLLSACDAERYRLLGCTGDHPNCADNLLRTLAEQGVAGDRVPSPWNLFENVAVGENGALEIQPPLSKPGDYVVLRAEMDVLIVFSACPMDVVPTNGRDCTPTDAHFRII